MLRCNDRVLEVKLGAAKAAAKEEEDALNEMVLSQDLL